MLPKIIVAGKLDALATNRSVKEAEDKMMRKIRAGTDDGVCTLFCLRRVVGAVLTVGENGRAGWSASNASSMVAPEEDES